MEAVAAYQKSWLMGHSSLFPRYSLAKLYYKHGQYDLAREVANGILNSEVKISSSAIRDIMIEVNEMMKEISNVLTQIQWTNNREKEEEALKFSDHGFLFRLPFKKKGGKRVWIDVGNAEELRNSTDKEIVFT